VAALAYSNALNERRALTAAHVATTQADNAAQRTTRRVDELEATIANLNTEIQAVLSARTPAEVAHAVEAAQSRQQVIEARTAATPITAVPTATTTPARSTTTVAPGHPTTTTTRPLACVGRLCVP
jgi:hypothetical protein